MKSKQTKAQKIAEIERKLTEALAGQSHTYHFAEHGLKTAGFEKLTGSGVVLTLTALGGREIVSPVLIRDGLSPESITALCDDLLRSFELANLYKPKGGKNV
jgi:hypothetical protein